MKMYLWYGIGEWPIMLPVLFSTGPACSTIEAFLKNKIIVLKSPSRSVSKAFSEFFFPSVHTRR